MVTPETVVIRRAAGALGQCHRLARDRVPDPSSRVAVTVEADVPLSVTEVGVAATVELDWDTGPVPVPKVTWAVWVMTRLDWEVSVAV